MGLHWGRGDAELLHYNDRPMNYDDANHARDLSNCRSISSSIHPLNGVATIAAVLAEDRTMPQLRHINVLITSLHKWHLMQHFSLFYTKSELMLADINTKLQAGGNYIHQIHVTHGVRFYPPIYSDHYKLTAFDKVNPN